MKRFSVVIIALILVVVTGYLGWSWNLDRQNQLLKNNNGQSKNLTQYSGILAKNNPGMKTNVWYLFTESIGKSAQQFELSFAIDSECNVGSRTIDCANLPLPNGSRVRVTGAINGESVILIKELVAEENSDLIMVDNVVDGDKLKSPFTVTGKARGNWYFEASFPVRLKDISGNVITSTPATALSDWMTTDFVPFSAKLDFNVGTDTPAELVLAADNPSGLPQNDRNISFKVVLLPTEKIKSVELYFYDPNLDKDVDGNIMCSEKGLVSVKRQVADTDKIIEETVRLLLEGKLTDMERSRGITTEYPLSGVVLKSINIEKGVATVDIIDPENKTSGGSCRVGVLWKQIEKTIKQFPGIVSVRFNPEYLFQP